MPNRAFWRALERVPGLATTLTEWRTVTREDGSLASRFLRRNGRTAASIACGDCGCRHEVIQHDDGDLVAICCCEPLQCDPRPLRPEDIEIHALSAELLGAQLARCFELDDDNPEPLTDSHQTWQLGRKSLDGGERVNVFLTIQNNADVLRRVAERLALEQPARFVLLTPSRRLIGYALETFLARFGACCLALEDLMRWEPGVGMMCLDDLEQRLPAPDLHRAASRSTSSDRYSLVERGQFWTLTFDGESIQLKNTLGVRYLARLLAQPGQALHVTDLYYSVNPPPAEGERSAEFHSMSQEQLNDAGYRIEQASAGVELLDAKGFETLKLRVQQLQEAIEEADEVGDIDQREALKEELDAIKDQLKAASGLRGRERKIDDDLKRMRDRVTKPIRETVATVNKHHARAGQHLRAAIRLGATCQYTPQPPIAWKIDRKT